MDWYYAENGQQKGPVSEEEFNRLIAAGTITPDTLVWREGMEQWQPKHMVTSTPPMAAPAPSPPAPSEPAEPGTVLCAECGRRFPQEQTIPYGSVSVCAECKPAFLQKLIHNDPAVSFRLFYFHGQQGQNTPVFPMVKQETRNGFRFQQGYVAAQNENICHGVAEHGHGALHGMPGPQLLGLQGKAHTGKLRTNSFDLIGLVSDHHDDMIPRYIAGRFQHIADHGFAQNGVEHFSQVAFHAGAEPGGQDDGGDVIFHL